MFTIYAFSFLSEFLKEPNFDLSATKTVRYAQPVARSASFGNFFADIRVTLPGATFETSDWLQTLWFSVTRDCVKNQIDIWWLKFSRSEGAWLPSDEAKQLIYKTFVLKMPTNSSSLRKHFFVLFFFFFCCCWRKRCWSEEQDDLFFSIFTFRQFLMKIGAHFTSNCKQSEKFNYRIFFSRHRCFFSNVMNSSITNSTSRRQDERSFNSKI